MAPKIPPPSKIDALSFPVFGLSWYGTPADSKNAVSALAYCGGGGSSKTGVFNKIAVLLRTNGYERTVEISTGEALCFGIHLFSSGDDMVKLLACVGDEVWLYGIRVSKGIADDESSAADHSEEDEEAILLGQVNIGKGYGANVTTYTQIFKDGKLVHYVAVGCENGSVLLYELNEQQSAGKQVGDVTNMEFVKTAECQGHTKAICAVHFHPRGSEVLTSAKDGTARIFSVITGEQLGIMECEIHDPTTAAAETATKRPPQILVRGCAYGDIEGKAIYTVASGRRGAAYLTKWKTLVPLVAPSVPPVPGGSPASSNKLSIRQEYRIQCSPVPISATSLSSDGTLFSLGSVEGSIILYNLETQKVLKTFQGHDLPVTCLASRPIPNVLMLPGELEGGVNYDVVSASADNRLGRWTLQKKSRIPPAKRSKEKRELGTVESFIWNVLRIPLLFFLLIAIMAIRDIFDLCREEVGLSALMIDMNAAGHCIYREVLWADSSRAGVRSVPE